jgi:two-component system response regulator
MPENDSVEILVVEDNETDLEMTLRALRRNSLTDRLHAVRDGQEALDYLFARGEYSDRNGGAQPRVILLDLKLPKVDGLDVLRILKSDPSTQSIPVVILTSSAEERDRVESYRLGVNSYIVKPVEYDVIVRAMTVVGLYWLLRNNPPLDYATRG